MYPASIHLETHYASPIISKAVSASPLANQHVRKHVQDHIRDHLQRFLVNASLYALGPRMMAGMIHRCDWLEHDDDFCAAMSGVEMRCRVFGPVRMPRAAGSLQQLPR